MQRPKTLHGHAVVSCVHITFIKTACMLGVYSNQCYCITRKFEVLMAVFVFMMFSLVYQTQNHHCCSKVN